MPGSTDWVEGREGPQAGWRGERGVCVGVGERGGERGGRGGSRERGGGGPGGAR